MRMTINFNRRNIAIAFVAVIAIVAAYLIGSSRPGSAQAAIFTNAAQPTAWTPTSSQATATKGAPTASSVSLTSSAITVTGSGVVTGTPNDLNVSLTVNDVAANVSDALATANQVASAVQASLASHGVATKDMQTSGMSIQQHSTNFGTPDGYQVSESLSVQIRDLTSAGSTLNAAILVGGNHVQLDGVNVSLDDSSALMADARAKAVVDARTKAGQFAAAAGRSLGAVMSISDNSAPSYPYQGGPVYAAASGAAASVPIQAGSTDVTITITVVFALV